MNDIRLISILFLLCVCVSACTNDNSSTVIELQSATSTRLNTTMYDDGGFRIDIKVNSGPLQTHLFETMESSEPVIVSGVRANEENSIEITWYKILNDMPVEISQQSDVFSADGNTTIDAPHTHIEFDYDNDGESNLSELLAGTCLLPATESCSGNLLSNGDFANGPEHWVSSPKVDSVSFGEYCAIKSTTSLGQSYMLHDPYLQLESNRSYTFAFDVRADTADEIKIAINWPNFEKVYSEDIAVSTSDTPRITRQFKTDGRDYSDIRVVFNITKDIDNVFCFDNIVLRLDPIE